MRGEGLLYSLAFLGILGVGAILIGPRLQRGSEPPNEAGRPGRTSGSPAAERPGRRVATARPSVPLADAPAPRQRVVSVMIEGPAGVLRGRLKPIVGAESRLLLTDHAGNPRVELTLAGPDREVAFGAAGHRWVRRSASSLVEGERILLPEAALPLTVRVREADGAPAPGVPVEVRPASPLGPRRADAGGTVVFDDLAPGLVVVLVGGMERAAPGLRLLAGEDREARVVLEPAWTVSGRAVGADGAPLAGVRVEAFEARGASGVTTPSDAQGRFTWRGPTASVLALRLTAPGLACESVEATPPATGTLATEVGDTRLAEPDVEIAGRVLGGGGRAAARVVAEPQVAALLREVFGADSVLDLPRTVPLEPDGSYRLTGLPSGVPLRLSLRGAGVPEDALVKPAAGQRLTQDFAPSAGETLRARVTDGVTGRPAAGTVVLLSREPVDGDLELPEDRRAVADEEGAIAVEGLEPGTHFLRAYRPGRRSLLKRVELPGGGETLLSFEAALDDVSRRLTGVVLDDLKQPLAGLTVRAAGVSARSGPDGTFTLDGVESLARTVTLEVAAEPGTEPDGSADLRVLSRGARVDVAPGGAPVTVYVHRDQTLALRATDGLTDAPIAFAQVVATADDGRVLVDRGFSLVDGRLVLSGLPRVGLTLSLFAPGRRFVRTLPGTEMATAARDAHGVRDLGEVRLLRALAIDGTVTDEQNAPVAGARVAAMAEGWLGGVRRDPAPRRELALRTTRSGPDGAFRLEGLDPAKPAMVVVWAPGFAPTLRRAVFALAGRPDPRAPGEAATPPAPDEPAGPPPAPRGIVPLEARAEVRLRAGSHVSLLLTDEGTRLPIHGAIVDLESARDGSDFLDLLHRGLIGGQAGSTAEWRAISENLLWEDREPGVYAVGPIEPGGYELVVEHPLYHPERVKVPVLDPSDPMSYEALEVDPGSDPSDPKVKRGPEMVRIYGGNRIRMPVDLRPR